MPGSNVTLGISMDVKRVGNVKQLEDSLKNIANIGNRLNEVRKKGLISGKTGNPIPPPPSSSRVTAGEGALNKQLSTQQQSNIQKETEISLLRTANKAKEKYGIALAKERILKKELMVIQQQENQIMEVAVRLMRERNITEEVAIVDATALIKVELAQAEALAIKTAAQQAANAQTAAAIQQNRMLQRNMIATSISMFVLTITLTQTLTALSQMVGTQTMLGKGLKEMTTIVKLSLGPLQVYTALMQMTTILNKQMLFSMMPWLAALAGLLLLWKGLKSAGAGLRAVLVGLGATILTLTLWTKGMVLAQQAWNVAKMIGTALAPGGAVKLTSAAIIASLAVGTFAAIFAAGTAKKKGFQTGPGQIHRITRSGLATVHSGELIGRPMGEHVSAFDGGGSGGTVIFNIQGDMSTELASRLQTRFLAGQINTPGL